jgi:hypothetical protein
VIGNGNSLLSGEEANSHRLQAVNVVAASDKDIEDVSMSE